MKVAYSRTHPAWPRGILAAQEKMATIPSADSNTGGSEGPDAQSSPHFPALLTAKAARQTADSICWAAGDAMPFFRTENGRDCSTWQVENLSLFLWP